jgi:hypothetical protein
VVPEFGRAGRSVGYGWSAVVTRPTMRAAEDVREEVGTPSFTPASLFDGLVHPILSAHHSIYHLKIGCCHPFREPLQFIVIAVMSVISGTFPDTNGVFYVTIKSWRVRGPSRHRHGDRHRRNTLPKRLPRYRDGDDAHDGHLQRFSRWWWRICLPSQMDLLNRSVTSERYVFYRLLGR